MFLHLYAWFTTRFHRDEKGAGAAEYVLVLMVVSLFLIVAAAGLQNVLSIAVSSISSWIATQPVP